MNNTQSLAVVIALVLAAMLAVGCQPSALPTNSQAATSPSNVPTAPPPPPGIGGNSTDAGDPQAALMAAYRAAHARKDVEAIFKLYCFDGASADVRVVTRENIEHELRYPVAAARLAPLPPGHSGVIHEGDVRLRPSLPEISQLTVDYDTSRKAPGEFAVSQAVLSIGMKGGRCYFTVPVREN